MFYVLCAFPVEAVIIRRLVYFPLLLSSFSKFLATQYSLLAKNYLVLNVSPIKIDFQAATNIIIARQKTKNVQRRFSKY